MSVQISYKKQVIFFIILVFITLIIIEGFVRILPLPDKSCMFQEQKIFENYTRAETKKICEEYSTVEFYELGAILIFVPNQQGQYFNTNSDGFRGKNIDFQSEAYKVFLLGGSTAGGYITSSDDFTIPALIEKKLQNYGLSVNVINAGIGGSTTMDERYYLENYILDYQPDMIIMYDGWNDVHFKYRKNLTYEEFANNTSDINRIMTIPLATTGPTPILYKTGIKKFFTEIDYKTGIGVAKYINDLRYNFNKYLENPADKEYIIKETLPNIEHSIENSWSNVCKLGEKYGFKTVNIIHPIIGTSDRIIPDETKSFLQNDEIILLSKLNIDENNLYPCENVYDFRNVFSGMDNIVIYFDTGHMTDFGNEIIAEKIYDKILPIILKDLG